MVFERTTTPLPTCWTGPVLVRGNAIHNEHVEMPLATCETPMWPSVNRGARVFTRSGGLSVSLIRERMTRSVVLRGDSAAVIQQVWQQLEPRFDELAGQASKSSRFVKLLHIHPQFLGNLMYLRFEYATADASGHNMTTLASENILDWILDQYPHLRYSSISANICCDKKVSAINGLLGRGKEVIAECVIPRKWLRRYLRTDAEAMMQIHIHKNLNGSLIAGSLRSANAHFANMLLAFYLATGQDGANTVEGSQGFTHLEARDQDLYFSVTLPNVVVGTVGNGKDRPEIENNLKRMGCAARREPGDNSRRLAAIAAAAVACGELSLLAAQTNRGELMTSHLRFER